MIPTVLGPVEAQSITGSCSSREELLHHQVVPRNHAAKEHELVTMRAIRDNPITLANLAEVRSSGDAGRLAPCNRLFSLDESVQELALLKDAGGGLVLACSAAGDGRDPSGLAEISRRTGLGVVMAASWNEVQYMCQCSTPWHRRNVVTLLHVWFFCLSGWPPLCLLPESTV